jgi:adenosylcobyric acid synthase
VKGLMIAGTGSDVGKSVLTAGICRWLARQGVKVAPFKGQNMSLNSFVTREGAEIGRAQAMQAQAARVEPTALMNPVLLKPGGDRSSQVVVLGRPVGELSARGYHGGRQAELLDTVIACLEELGRTHDAVVCEGAGSPAEINLRRTDIVNMAVARRANLPVLVTGDIDRGGVFASFYGTTALLDPADQALIAGYVVNKFRGDITLLRPGLDMLDKLTGRPTLGVLPYARGLGIDEEDGLHLRESAPTGPPHGRDILRVAVAAVPLMSNFTDVDALAAEPGVVVRFTDRPEECEDADLLVLPGTRGTVKALRWLRERGLADAVVRRAARGRPVLGVCGGYQMLGEAIEDEVESRAGIVAGLGLLPLRIRFAPDKTLARPCGRAYGQPVEGYEIHHGVAELLGGQGAFDEPFLDGGRAGAVWGTHWHGSLESDGFRRAFLREVAARAGRRFVPAPDTRFGALREAQLERLADLVAEHMDTAALLRLIEGGAPAGLPFLPPGAP